MSRFTFCLGLKLCLYASYILTLKVLVTTIDAQWEGMGCRVGEVRAGTTSPMPDHKGFKLQELVKFQKFSTLRVNDCGECAGEIRLVGTCLSLKASSITRCVLSQKNAHSYIQANLAWEHTYTHS